MPDNTSSSFGLDEYERRKLEQECMDIIAFNATVIPGE